MLFLHQLVSLTGLVSLTSALAYGSLPRTEHYLVPSTNLALSNKLLSTKNVFSQDGLSLVKLNDAEVNELASAIHEQKNICGGFVNVEMEILQGQKPSDIIRSASKPSPLRFAQDEYRIKYPAESAHALEKFNLNRYREALTALAGFPDRYSKGTNGAAAAEWIQNKMLEWAKAEKRTDVTAEQIAIQQSGYPQASVIVKIPGRDPRLPAVAIGGHFDTFPRQKPGADDDGSGSSLVMEVFRSILNSNLRFQRDLYFMFYAAEEMGLVGSKYVVREFVRRQTPIRAVLQFDMVGYKGRGDAQDLYLLADNTSATLTQFIRQVAIQHLKIPADRIGSTRCGYGCSDHASWHQAGFPAALPFEASFERYNPNIHTEEDGLHLIDWNHAEKFVRLGLATMVELGEPVTSNE